MAATKKTSRWRPSDDEQLKALYDTIPASAIAEKLGRTKASIKNRVTTLGLTKGHNSGKFMAGQTPWNKGRHYQAGGRSAETRFKAGERQGRANALYRPIGTERTSKDGYLERKINDGMPPQKRWRAVHLLNWEAINGQLPAGHALAFKDGNKQNTDPANLELITRAELMRRNTIHNYPEEIARVVQLRGAITRQINKQAERQQK